MKLQRIVVNNSIIIILYLPTCNIMFNEAALFPMVTRISIQRITATATFGYIIILF